MNRKDSPCVGEMSRSDKEERSSQLCHATGTSFSVAPLRIPILSKKKEGR